ncbi:hypothetical protein ACIBK9_49795 [Nonomuraea sp. NPDC050227]|uniref:hypothetical protein n=1 Tax=Nonomuraea sp. NPDC050227 TaxID=3364360 RepID=UPI00378B483D
MAEIGIVLAVGTFLVLLGMMNVIPAISPDGRRYLSAGRGEPVSMPFALRWLLPTLCRDRIALWRWSTTLHLLALPVLVTIWLEPWIPDARLRVTGGLMICGLSGVWRIHLRWPVLVDAAAMTWAVAAAVAFQKGMPILGVGLALVSGSIKESGPVFAACYAWNPLALVALVGPLARRLTVRTGEDLMGQPHVTHQPLIASRVHHLGKWFDPKVMILPWGAGVLAVLAEDARFLPMLIVTLALAYGQTVIATDTSRLYQWAAPPVILAAVSVIPDEWAIALLIAHLFNPWAGTAEV